MISCFSSIKVIYDNNNNLRPTISIKPIYSNIAPKDPQRVLGPNATVYVKPPLPSQYQTIKEQFTQEDNEINNIDQPIIKPLNPDNTFLGMFKDSFNVQIKPTLDKMFGQFFPESSTTTKSTQSFLDKFLKNLNIMSARNRSIVVFNDYIMLDDGKPGLYLMVVDREMKLKIQDYFDIDCCHKELDRINNISL